MQITLFKSVDEGVKNHKALSYKGLYALHKYWGKKPFNIVRDFIEMNTEKGELVLDPFCGSGVSVSEAVFSGRKGIGIDLNPASIFITENIIKSISPKDLQDTFDKIQNCVRDEINRLYQVNHNGETYIGKNFLWEKGTLKEIRYSNGGRKNICIEPQLTDIDLATTIDRQEIADFYPHNTLFHNSRINAKKGQKVYELFTSRNLKALSILYKKIEEIEEKSIREMFKFCFTSALGQASKMVFVIKRRNKTKGANQEKREVGSWVIGYWQPKDFFENNVWFCFENRYKKLLKAKKEQFKTKKTYVGSDQLKNVFTDVDFVLSNSACQDSLKELPDNSVDYILTDPPHSNRIPYLELSMLWNSWLMKDVDYEKEIIISEAKDRKKGIENYTNLLSKTIKESHRVLKPNRKFSLMFNSLDDESWWAIMKMFNDVGFELSKVETMGYSANSVVQDNRKNGLKTDFENNTKPEIYQIINYVLCKALINCKFTPPTLIIEQAKSMTQE